MADCRSTDRGLFSLFPLGARMILFSLAYFGCALISSLFTFHPGPFTNFWLPSGLFVAVLIINDRNYWLGLVLAGLVTNVAFHVGHGEILSGSLLLAGENVLEALLGAWMVRRYVADRPTLSTIKEVAGIVSMAAFGAPILSATMALIVLMFGQSGGSYYWLTWFLWWGGDALGVLLLMPLIIVWQSVLRRPLWKWFGQHLDAVLFMLVVSALAVFVFWYELHEGLSLKYLMLPVQMWVAIRFAMPGIVVANLWVSLIAAGFTLYGYSDISAGGVSLTSQSVALQLYLTIISSMGLLLAALLSERKHAEQASWESEQKFRNLAEESPNMIFINKKGKVIFANRLCSRIMKYRIEEFYAPDFNFANLIVPEQREFVKANFLRHMAGGEVPPCEYTLLTKEAERIEVIINTSLIDFDGERAVLGIVTVITDRKRAEEALKESEDKFWRAFQRSPALMAISTIEEGRFVEVNDCFLATSGYTREEVIGKTSIDLHVFGDAMQRAAVMQEVERKGRIRNFECTVRTKYGEERFGFFSADVIELKHCKYLLTVMNDITERKRIEKALQDSEARYRKLVDSTTDYIYTVRVENGKAVQTVHGPGCLAVTGYDAEDYQADPYLWFRMIYPDDRTVVLKQAAKALLGETTVPLEHRIVHKDGGLRWLRNTTVLHKDQSGLVCSYDGLISDITERKRVEEEVRRVASVKEGTLESTADGILVVDNKGKILDFNEKFAQMWQIPDHILNMKDDGAAVEYVLDQLVDPQVFIDKVRTLYSHPESESVDVLEFKNGRVFERYSRSLKIEDQAVGRVWSFRDITAQKRAEEALKRAKEQAEAADRAKSEFLTNISHDFRTPLSAISGFSAMLGSAQMDDRSKKILGIIKDKSQSLLTMTGDILDASGMRTGKIRLRVLEFDFKKLINDAVEVARMEAAGKELSISCIFEGVIPHLKGDPIRVEQVIANILANAVKYTEKGEIKVRVVCSVKPDSPERRLVKVSVKDTGLGIPPDKQSQIFEPFTRFHEFAGGKHYKGVGLGLHIAKTMVNLMGGEIGVVSEVGKGSEFTFNLDLRTATESHSGNGLGDR